MRSFVITMSLISFMFALLMWSTPPRHVRQAGLTPEQVKVWSSMAYEDMGVYYTDLLTRMVMAQDNVKFEFIEFEPMYVEASKH